MEYSDRRAGIAEIQTVFNLVSGFCFNSTYNEAAGSAGTPELQGFDFDPDVGCYLCILPMAVRAFTLCSGYLPSRKNVWGGRLIDD